MSSAASNTPNALATDAPLERAAHLLRASGRYEVLELLRPAQYEEHPRPDPRPGETVVLFMAAALPEGGRTDATSPGFEDFAVVRASVSEDALRLVDRCSVALQQTGSAGVARPEDLAAMRRVCVGAHVVIAAQAARLRPLLGSFEALTGSAPWTCASTDVDWGERGSPSDYLRHLLRRLGKSVPERDALATAEALVYVLVYPQPGTEDRPPPLLELLDKASRQAWFLIAPGTPFVHKNALRARGYVWNDSRDLQLLDVAAFSSPALHRHDDVLAELEWLHQTCFPLSKTATVLIACDDASHRFHPARRSLLVQGARRVGFYAAIKRYRDFIAGAPRTAIAGPFDPGAAVRPGTGLDQTPTDFDHPYRPSTRGQ
jgi:hypothetical protein